MVLLAQDFSLAPNVRQLSLNKDSSLSQQTVASGSQENATSVDERLLKYARFGLVSVVYYITK